MRARSSARRVVARARRGRPGSRSACASRPSCARLARSCSATNASTDPAARTRERLGRVVGALEQQRAQQVGDRHALARAQVDARLRRRRPRSARRARAARAAAPRSRPAPSSASSPRRSRAGRSPRAGRGRGRRARRRRSPRAPRCAAAAPCAAARARRRERGERHGQRRVSDRRPRRALWPGHSAPPCDRSRPGPGGAGRARGAGDARSRTRCPVTSPCGSSVGLSARSSSSETPVLLGDQREVVAGAHDVEARVAGRACPRRARRRSRGCARLALARGRRPPDARRTRCRSSPPSDAITTIRKTIAKTASAAGASSLRELCWWALMPEPMIPARPRHRIPCTAAQGDCGRQRQRRRDPPRRVAQLLRDGRAAAASPASSAGAARSSARRSRAPPPGGRANAGARSSTRPPWAPTPGSRKTACGIALAQRREQRRLGRRDDRAHVGRARPARRRRAPSSRTSVGEPVAQRRRSAGAASWISAAPGLEVRTSTNTPAPARARGRDERLERVAAEQRVRGDGVGAEARRPCPRASSVAPSSAWA